MNKRNIFGAILPMILLLSVIVAKADVPPPPGFGRIKQDLILDTKEDLSDYRFFLDFYGDLREIKVNNNAETIISPMGGGARYAVGTLLAVPKEKLAKSVDDSPDSLKKLFEAMREKKIEGVTELTRHSFSEDKLLGLSLTTPSYTIVREANILKLNQASNPNTFIIIAGILIALAVGFFGVFIFRKARKKV